MTSALIAGAHHWPGVAFAIHSPTERLPLCRVFCKCLLNPAAVFAGLGVDDYYVSFVYKEGHVDLRSCFEGDNLVASLGGVAFDRGRSLCHFEFNFDW